jgi:tRNA (guanine-N7-)-methyltransferase
MTLGTATQKYLVPWTRLDWPLDWTFQFQRPGLLRAELGFGDGEYLEKAALAEPEINWVGIEVSWFSVRRILRRIEERGIENVRVIQADAAVALERLFPGGSLDALVINHADPWPKKRHHGRRLVQDRFLAVAAGRLRPGGRVTLATDHAEYAEWIARALAGAPALQSAFPTDRVAEIPGRPSTKYERKGRKAGAVIHIFVWEKTGEESRWLPREERILPMPNVLLEGVLQFERLFENWGGRQEREVQAGIEMQAPTSAPTAGSGWWRPGWMKGGFSRIWPSPCRPETPTGSSSNPPRSGSPALPRE